MTDIRLAAQVDAARERYTDLYLLRAGVQAIPWVGGPLDTLISGGVAQIQAARIQDFLQKLDDRMRNVETASANLEDEALSDVILATFERVSRSRSESKRARFARILSRQVEVGRPWDEAERAVRLLGELEDIHVDVLRAVLNAPPVGAPFDGLQVVALDHTRPPDGGRGQALLLASVLPAHDHLAMRMACAELVSRGLLHDEGIGRLDAKALNLFVITDLGRWFIEWLRGD